MLTVILAAIVAVVYSHENPDSTHQYLYIGGILAGIHVWNKKK